MQRRGGKGKPASSSKAATLVATEGEYRGFIRVTAGDDLGQLSSSEFQLAFKKLNKRDSVTKLKGLQELKTLFEDIAGKGEDVDAVIQAWVYSFLRLAADDDPKVRVALCNTFAGLVQAVKKKLAAQLKRIMGTWLCLQFDQSNEVANAAKKAFQVAFPAKKHSEALLFCKAEILDHFEANFAQTPQTLANENAKEKAEDRYSNLIFSSILAFRYFQETIPEAENQALAESRYNELLGKKFWNFLKDKKHLLIRRAAYQLLATVSHKARPYVEANISWLTPVVVGLLNDTESSNQAHMWEALLTFFKYYPEAWSHINARKQVLGPLWVILRNGTSGSAAVTYPSLLPLISLIPKEVVGEGTGFHKEFFSNLWKGLASENFSDTSATRLVAAYMECLLYFISLDLRNDEREESEATDIAQYLVANQLFDATHYYLTTDKPPSALVKSISGLVGKLVAKDAQDIVKAYFIKLGDDAKAVFSENQDNLPLATYCSRFSELLSSLAALLSSSENTSGSALEQVLREVVGTALPRAREDTTETAWVRMLTELAASFPALVFGSAAAESEAPKAFFADALLPWVTSWVSSEARDAAFTPVLFDLVHHYLQHIAAAGGDHQTALLHDQWESLVREVIATGKPRLLLLLLQKVCRGTANEQWASRQLDEHATHLFNALQAGAAAVGDDIELSLLRFLIAGKDNQASPLLSASCLAQIVESLSASLTGFLDGHSLAAGAALEADAEQLASLKDVLVLVRSVASARLPAGLQRSRASLLGNTVFRLHLLAQLSPPGADAAAAYADVNSTALASLSAFATSRLREEEPETAAAFRAYLVSSLHEAVLHAAPTSIAAASDVAVQVRKWTELDKVKSSAAELVLDRAEWEKSRDAVPSAIDGRDTSSLFLRLTGAVTGKGDETNDAATAAETYACMALFATELLQRLSAPVLLAGGGDDQATKPHAWLISALLQSYSLSGVSLFSVDESEDLGPVISQSLLSGSAANAAEPDEEDEKPSNDVWSLLARQAPRGVALLAKFITDQAKADTEPNAFTRDLLQHLIDEAQQCGGLSALSLAFVLRLLVARADLSCEALASVIVPALPLSFNANDDNFYGRLAAVEASIPVIAGATSGEVTQAREIAAATFASLKEAQTTSEEDARRVLFSMAALAAFYWPQAAPQSAELAAHMSTLAGLFPKGRWPNAAGLPAALSRGLRTGALRLSFAIVTKSGATLDRASWDFVLNLVKSGLVDTKAKAKGSSIPDVADATEALRLLWAVMRAFQALSASEQSLPVPEEKYHSFLSKLLPQVFEVFLAVGQRLSKMMERDNPLSVLLEQVVRSMPSSLLCKHISGRESDDSVHALLSCPDWRLQKTAYRLLLHKLMAIAAVPDDEEGKDKEAESAEEEKEVKAPLPPALQEQIERPSEDFHGLLGYLLGWSLVLDHCTLRSPEFRARLGSYLRRSSFSLQMFMRVLCQHLDLQHPHASTSLPPPQSFKIADMVSTSDEWIGAYAAHLYLRLLQAFPALVRLWWTDDCDRQTAALMEKYTMLLMSPILIENELAAIANYKSEAGNFQVKASKVTREVTATYEKDEMSLAVVMRLAPSYPLRSVELESKSRLGVSEAQWRKWMLSMTTLFLTHDGTILDGVLLWKQNLDRHFEGVECCPICYSLFHISDHSLPRLACKTCHNKFHSACMYKWIRVSHNTDCPLCKTPFN